MNEVLQEKVILGLTDGERAALDSDCCGLLDFAQVQDTNANMHGLLP